MNKTLIDFERQIGLGSTYAARVLGVAYQTYASYRNERRPLPRYHARHIRHFLMLPVDVRKKELEVITNGNKTI